MSLFDGSDGQNKAADAIPPNALAQGGAAISGISGNELYCTALAGYTPGNILVGNSVNALGVLGGITSAIHTTIGGEITRFTEMISEGRRMALNRFELELQEAQGAGAVSLSSEIIFHPNNIEFLAVGSSLYLRDNQPANGAMTAAANGQELFCQIDAGFQPIRFAFGNVAYSIGIARGLLGSIRQLAHGEVKEYSNIFNTTRHMALQRITDEARGYNANSVIGIRTTILPLHNNHIQEMMMVGTAAYHPQLADLAQQAGGVVTSDLTADEMWTTMKMGYAPMQMILGTSVYSLGLLGGIKAALREIAKGEVTNLTELVYSAREESLKKLQNQANEIGADMVLGVKTFIYHLDDNLLEFLAIGTAVKRVDGLATRSEQLPVQAIIHDRDTFVNKAESSFNASFTTSSGDETKVQSSDHSKDSDSESVAT